MSTCWRRSTGWAPVGERPVALGHHRFEWLYVTGFVEPTTGQTVWNVANAVCKEMFELILADFAKSVCAAEIDTAPADAAGQMNFPRSSRLA